MVLRELEPGQLVVVRSVLARQFNVVDEELEDFVGTQKNDPTLQDNLEELPFYTAVGILHQLLGPEHAIVDIFVEVDREKTPGDIEFINHSDVFLMEKGDVDTTNERDIYRIELKINRNFISYPFQHPNFLVFLQGDRALVTPAAKHRFPELAGRTVVVVGSYEGTSLDVVLDSIDDNVTSMRANFSKYNHQIRQSFLAPLYKRVDDQSQVQRSSLSLPSEILINQPPVETPTAARFQRKVEMFFNSVVNGHVNHVADFLMDFPKAVEIKKSGNGKSPFQLAVENRKWEMALTLMLFRARPDEIVETEKQRTIMHTIIRENCPTDKFEQFLWKVADLNISDSDGDTLLHYAVKYDRFELLQVLCSFESTNPNLMNSSRKTPLYCAIWKGSLDPSHRGMIQTLVQHQKFNPEFSSPHGNIAHWCAEYDDHETLEYILQRPELRRDCSFVNVRRERDRYSPLHVSIRHRSLRSLDALLTNPFSIANCEVDTAEGYSALILACLCFTSDPENYSRIITRLVAAGIDLDHQDNNGFTALHHCISSAVTEKIPMRSEVLRRLETYLSNRNIEILAFTELLRAFPGTFWVPLSCYLISKGAKLDFPDFQGDTPNDKIVDGDLKRVFQRAKRLSPHPHVANVASSTSTSNGVSKMSSGNLEDCGHCQENRATVRLLPCGHIVYCQFCIEHYPLPPKCKICKVLLEKDYVCENGTKFQKTWGPNPVGDPESENRRLNPSNDKFQCKICMENDVDIHLVCGHLICEICFQRHTAVQNKCPFCSCPNVKEKKKKMFT